MPRPSWFSQPRKVNKRVFSYFWYNNMDAHFASKSREIAFEKNTLVKEVPERWLHFFLFSSSFFASRPLDMPATFSFAREEKVSYFFATTTPRLSLPRPCGLSTLPSGEKELLSIVKGPTEKNARIDFLLPKLRELVSWNKYWNFRGPYTKKETRTVHIYFQSTILCLVTIFKHTKHLIVQTILHFHHYPKLDLFLAKKNHFD